MGKLLKILLSVVGVLIVLVVIAAIVLPLVVDPNDFRQKIMTTVHDQTGRTLEIDGDISLSVFPWLGLDIGTTRLGNASGFDAPYMASMDAVQVRVKLLPLLKKQVEIDTVKLDGLQLHLARDKAGHSNWDDLTGKQAAPQETAASPGTGTQIEHLAIGGIEISKASLSWDDRQSGAQYEVDDLSLVTSQITEGKPFDLRLGLTLRASQPAVQSRLSLNGTVLPGKGLRRVDIKPAALTLNATGAAVPGGRLDVSITTDVALDLDAQTLDLPAIVLEAADLKLTGKVAGTGIGAEQPAFSGNLVIAEFAPRTLFKSLGMAAPETTDSSVLGKAAASLTWDATPTRAAVSKLDLTLDDTHVSGKLGVSNFSAPVISFTLAVDSIDLDRYLPPPPPKSDAAPAPAKAASAAPSLEGLRALNLSGTVTVAKMKASGLSYSDAVLTVKANDGVVRLHPIGAQLYGGSYKGDITLDARNKTPRISVNEKVSSVQAGPLLKDLLGDDQLQGTANLTAKFDGTGLTPEELRRSVSGNAAFSFRDGTVKGVNLVALIRKTKATLKGQPLPPDDEPNQTDFAELSGTLNVTNGLARNDDLTLLSPLLRVAGKGETSLATETIDYTLTTKIVGSLEGQGGKGLEDLKGVEIPVHIGGTWSKPKYKPDVDAALSAVAKSKAREKVEEKVQKKLGNELGDKLLKGLFR